MTYRLIVAPSALRQLDRLPEKVTAAVIEFLAVIEDRPTIVGKPLREPLADHWSARRGAYRVLYLVEGDLVRVVRIDHRSRVYRSND